MLLKVLPGPRWLDINGDVEHEKGAAPGGSSERESNAGTED